jgi:hypothetical protein
MYWNDGHVAHSIDSVPQVIIRVKFVHQTIDQFSFSFSRALEILTFDSSTTINS